MVNSAVTIGGIVLQQFEIPSAIDFGGQQRLVVHRLSGGNRIIELLGPDENEIHFQGIFSGPAAESRVRALDSLRKSGATVPLTWCSFQYPVIVNGFFAEYNNPAWIRYRISCVVASQVGMTASPEDQLQAATTNDLASAATIVGDVPVNFAALSSAVGASGALTLGTAANGKAYDAVQVALSATNSQIASQAIVLAASYKNDSIPPSAISSFQTQLNAVQEIAVNVHVKAYLGRVCMNLKVGGS